jgi:hypothetical protein
MWAMLGSRTFGLGALATFALACGASPAPVPPQPGPGPVQPARVAVDRAREDFAVGESPMTLVVVRGVLYWTDAAGAIWSMPATGGTPRQLSSQRDPDFAFSLFVAGTEVFATSRKDLLRVAGPGGPVTRAGITGLADNPEEYAASTEHIYLTMFKRTEIVRVPVRGGAATKIGELPRGILALYGDTLYATSYASGVLIAMPVTGGAPRTIARGLLRPTALAVDGTHAFVYSEREHSLRRIELATGASAILASELVNSDDVVLDGDWVYTRSWSKPHGTLVRVAKDGSRPAQVIANDLASPYRIAIDDAAIYVTSRDGDEIVRVVKSSL